MQAQLVSLHFLWPDFFPKHIWGAVFMLLNQSPPPPPIAKQGSTELALSVSWKEEALGFVSVVA